MPAIYLEAMKAAVQSGCLSQPIYCATRAEVTKAYVEQQHIQSAMAAESGPGLTSTTIQYEMAALQQHVLSLQNRLCLLEAGSVPQIAVDPTVIQNNTTYSNVSNEGDRIAAITRLMAANPD